MKTEEVHHGVSTLLGITAAIVVTLMLGMAAHSPNALLIAAAFPPWWDEARIFQAAGSAGRIVGVGLLPSIVVVRGEPGLAGRLRETGALFTFDAGARGGCHGPGEGRRP